MSKEYKKNDVPFEGYTTYRLSYWPNNNHPVRRPFKPNKTTQNISNVNGGFNDKTAYNLSEHGNSNCIYTRPKDNLGFSSLPLECNNSKQINIDILT